MKLEFIRKNVDRYPLKDLCEALEVAPSAYHERLGRKPSARACEDEILKQEILKIHVQSKGRFGHRLMYGQVRDRCGRDRTLRLMRLLGIVGKQEFGYRPSAPTAPMTSATAPTGSRKTGRRQGLTKCGWPTRPT